MIETPYLLFLGDAPDGLAAKVAQGIKDWRPEYAVGQFRLEGCKADMKLPDFSIAEAVEKGVKTLVIGVANRGGVISPAEPVMLIVPEGDDLALEVRIRPQDIDQIRPGQKAMLRLSAFNLRTTPELEGYVSRVAADHVPFGHFVHSAAPVGEYVPAPQALQALKHA